MGRPRDAHMRTSRYTRRVTIHHVPPPTAYRPITTHTIRRGTHIPDDPAPMAARRHSSAQGATTTRRASRDATSVSRWTSPTAGYFVLFFCRARTRARLDDARGRRGDRRSSPDRDRIEIRARRRDRHPFGHRVVRARGVESSATRDARVIGRWREGRDAGRGGEGRVDDGPIARAHPSSIIHRRDRRAGLSVVVVFFES